MSILSKKSLKSKSHKVFFIIAASPTYKQKTQSTCSLLIFNLTLHRLSLQCKRILSTHISIKSHQKTKNIKEHWTALIAARLLRIWETRQAWQPLQSLLSSWNACGWNPTNSKCSPLLSLTIKPHKSLNDTEVPDITAVSDHRKL